MGISAPLCGFQGKTRNCHFHGHFIPTAKTPGTRKTGPPGWLTEKKIVHGLVPAQVGWWLQLLQAHKTGSTHWMLQCSPAFPCLRGCRGSKGEDFISRPSVVATIFPSDFYWHLVQVPHFKEEGYCYFPTSESCDRA